MKQIIKESLATLLVYTIKIDDVVTDKEVELFCSLMKQDFGCNRDEAFDFLINTTPKESSIDKHVDIINNALKDDQLKKMHILEQLNHVIYTDGISPKEYEVFDKIKKRLFSNIED